MVVSFFIKSLHVVKIFVWNLLICSIFFHLTFLRLSSVQISFSRPYCTCISVSHIIVLEIHFRVNCCYIAFVRPASAAVALSYGDSSSRQSQFDLTH